MPIPFPRRGTYEWVKFDFDVSIPATLFSSMGIGVQVITEGDRRELSELNKEMADIHFPH